MTLGTIAGAPNNKNALTGVVPLPLERARMLDEYSLIQRSRLAELRPDWLPYFGEYDYEDSDDSYLLIKLPSVGNSAEILFLYTANQEVTIAFGVWECHYSEYTSWEHGELQEALAEIDKFQNDELVAVSLWHGDQWLGSKVLPPGEPVLAPEFVRGAKTAKIISWSGNFTREVAL